MPEPVKKILVKKQVPAETVKTEKDTVKKRVMVKAQKNNTDEDTSSGLTVGGGVNSESKSLNLNANYQKGNVGVDMSADLSKKNKSVSANINYETKRLSSGVTVEKSSGSKPNVSVRASYKF